MLRNRFLVLSLGLLTFVNIYYDINSFAFNASTNNIEELPFIYKLSELSSYPNDEYVKQHTSNFTQITPYIFFITSLVKIFHLEDLTVLFFILHAITICLLYFSIRQILKYLSEAPESLIILSTFSLNLLLKATYFIPNNRTLFYDFLDPEFLTYPFILFTLGFHIKKERMMAFFSLLITSILHPLYAIPLFPTLVLSEMKNLKNHFLYFLAIFPYTIFLWFKSRQTLERNISASMTCEIIRAPHHYKIPTLQNFDQQTFIFYLISTSLLIISFILFKKFSPEKKYQPILKINFLLITLLIFTSIISSFIKIPILVQLTPYRIGVIIVILSWILFCDSLFEISNKISQSIKKFDLLIVISLLLISLIPTLKQENSSLATNKDFFLRKEVISWIRNNTSRKDLFLNYSDLDIRTETLRSDYFKFQTSPLTANDQITWYKQFLIFYDVPDSIPLTSYQEAKDFASSYHEINIGNVLKRSKASINYIILLKNKKSFSKITDLVNLSNKNYTYNVKEIDLVFENGNYAVYKSKKKSHDNNNRGS